MSKKTLKNKDNPWKKKAISRTKIIKKHNKRIQELIASRDGWKNKCKQNEHNASLGHFDKEKAVRHQYPIQMVLLMVVWQAYGQMSLRSVRHCFAQLQIVFNLHCRVPSHSSIRNWLCKSGYYRIQREQQSVRNPAEQWALVIDESITIGSEKILLVLGLELSTWQFTKSLSVEDVRVLAVETSKGWSSEMISQRLKDVGRTHNISYVISDGGINLKCALRLSSLVHVPDCSHVAANALARQYTKHEGYISLSKSAGALRRKWYLSKNVVYMPPVQRSKSRFQNIFPTIEWALTIVQEWERIPIEARAELMFVKDNEALVVEMFEQITVVNSLLKILKVKGFTPQAKEQITVLIDTLKTPRGQLIRQEIASYLTTLSSLTAPEETLVCCSDIIESYFGKFKQKINPNSPHSMTEFVLTIANFAGAFNKQEIKEALEQITCKDLSKWNKNDASLAKKRKKIFNKNGTKKAA